MEVLFITHKYPPIIGGMEKQSFELTTRMSKKHTVHLHAYKGEGSKLMWFLSLKKEIKRMLLDREKASQIFDGGDEVTFHYTGNLNYNEIIKQISFVYHNFSFLF